MIKIVDTEKTLNEWLKHVPKQVEGQPFLQLAETRLRADMRVLDDCYGKNRNLEKDLGGYMVILYGNQEEIKTEYKELLEHHNLEEQNYEYEDNQKLDDYLTVSIQLFLCSSDYAVEIVIIKENGGNKNE